MKRTIMFILISVVAVVMVASFSLIGCKAEPEVIIETVTEIITETVVETVEVESSGLKIAYMQTGPFPYYENSASGARLAGELLGIEILIYNTDLKPEKEIANIEDAIAQGVDGILLFSISSDAANQSIALANAAGIPIHMIYGYSADLEDKVVGFIQSNGEVSGNMVGTWVADNIESGQIGQVQGALGRGDAEAYTQGFADSIAANPNLEIVSEQPGDWDPGKAYTVMENMITAFPDLKACFVQNEPMAISASKALKVHDKDDQVAIVSQNGSPEGVTAIELGIISATTGWSPSKECQIAFARLLKAIDGETIEEKLIYTPMKVLTIDNLAEVDPWVPTLASTQAVMDEYYGSN